MAIVGIAGFSYLTSVESAFNLFAKDIFSTFSSYSLTVIPMFIFMGQIAFSSGIANKLYVAAYGFLGRTRGGMAMATMLASAAFSAICGSTNATAASMYYFNTRNETIQIRHGFSNRECRCGRKPWNSDSSERGFHCLWDNNFGIYRKTFYGRRVPWPSSYLVIYH